jgi:Xaa-Pro aminopeptidase
MTAATERAREVALARAERLEHEFTAVGLQGALVFEPVNIEFAAEYDVNVDVGLGRPARCALVTIGDEPVIWEHEDVIRVTELTRDSTRSRRATDVSELWASPKPTAAAFAGEVRRLLSTRRVDGPIGVDNVSVHLLEAMSSAGIVLRDANSALRRARAVNSAAEIDGFRDAVTLAQSAIDAAAKRVQPGVDAHELSEVLTAAAMDRGAREWLAPPAASRRVTTGDLVAVHCCARWEGGYLVDIVRMLPCGPLGAPACRLLAAGTQMLEVLLSGIRPGAAPWNVVAHARTLVPEGCEVSASSPLLHGCGVSFEHPIVGWFGGDSDDLRSGMVLSVGFELSEVRGGVIELRDQVALTDAGCVPLAAA